MTRRHHQSPTSDNGSLKENKDINLTGCSAVKIKAEKVRQQHQASGRMGKGKKRATEEEEDEDENHDEQDDDAGGDEDDEEGGGSPKGRKRARVNMEGDGRPSQSQAEEVAVIVKTQPRDTDGFIPGQIVRMQLHNFLTYDFTEFACGPYLNMIIGPNGTGKSSIACAIALGLNWPPSILGRAENIQSFVKNDKETGYVEIEMKGPKGKPNLIIRRNINSASKTNSFTLNGKPATGKEVATKMAELNVQISNLCTFLPQDKVSSFAMMSPQQLLKETQRAAGDRNLTAWHETLIKSGSEHRTMLQAIKEEEDQLHQMQERNAAIEKEVERYNERKRIEEQIALFDILIPVARYEELFEKYGRLKLEQRRLHAKVQKLKQKNAPAHELLETLNKDLQQADKARERKKEAIKKRFDQMSSKWNQNTKLASFSPA
ncbi:structural maintenance of chromosome complex subunit [Moniliophthora roreri MCA 2997]|uniref:Structural maintenance of chromosomes protein 5 n=1 Tax=Moniliophthora roreri (strain MCA 2997) TaxID=1381753 RepID=V2WI41_MONRO|nr:structural maintenance of chromosome complex subunit [Moniliophthora roreri MCA 2997]